MSTFNVVEALKQKLINDQKQNEQHAPVGYQSREARNVQEPEQPDKSGFLSRENRDYERRNDRYQQRENRDYDRGFDRRDGRRDDRPYGRNYDRNYDRNYGRRDDRRYHGRDYRGSRDNDYVNDRFDDRFRRDYDKRDRRRDDTRHRERTNDRFGSYQEDLSNVIPIDQLERKSLWDIKPKGFEKISSERAKISGLFPLPGESKRIDISKLEGLVSSGYLNSQTSILFEQKSISSQTSRNSKQLIITGVEFTLFPVERLVDYLKNYIDSLNLEEAFIVNYELLQSKYLVLQLSNHIVTTILFSSFNYFQKDLNLKIQLERPDSYITPIFTDEESIPKESIFDDKNKLAITNIPFDIQENELRDDLEDIGPVSELAILKDREGNSRGVAFAKFTDLSTTDVITKINSIVINESTLFAFHASKGRSQSKSITYRSISDIAVSTEWNNESNVLLLLNAVLPEDLKNPTIYETVEREILTELSKYGKVDSIKIPKPDSTYKRNLKHLHTNVGKIFVKFSEKESAIQASKEVHGRKYNERTVLVSFIPEKDFEFNLF